MKFMADFLSRLFTYQTQKKNWIIWHATNYFSRNPEGTCAVNSTWNIAVVYRLRPFDDGNLTTFTAFQHTPQVCLISDKKLLI